MSDPRLSRFVHLHAHTTYSPLDGYGTPKQVVDRVKSLGHKAVAITDHGNCYGHVAMDKAARDAGIKPIFGCEFYLVENAEERGRYQAGLGVEGFPHITILARTQEGYENFLKLINDASKHFYYYPLIDRKMLYRRQKGLIVLSGCPTGWPTRLIAQGREEDALRFVKDLRDNCEQAYVECVPSPGYDPSESATSVLFDIARELHMRAVLTGDAHFPRPEDHIVQNLMLHIAFKTPYNAPMRVQLAPYYYYCSASELMQRACDASNSGAEKYKRRILANEELYDALAASGDIADSCDVEIAKGRSVSFPKRGSTPPGEALWKAIVDGADERISDGMLDPAKRGAYLARAKREFDVIDAKGFSDYLLAITDICRWAKEQDTLVMCRGSAGGCQILWLTGASETDAIEHELSFERFYDENRPDPPDVDVDFETWMKPAVIKYIVDTYGQDHCASILALGLMRSKVAVIDTANVLNIPRTEYEPLTMALDSKDDELDKQMDDITDPQIVELLRKYPMLKLASKLVGQVRQASIHAAGILVSADPLYKCIAQIEVPGKAVVSSVDKHGAAALGLLKFDLLSVMAFDVTAAAARAVGLKMKDLYRLKFNDPAVYDTAKRGLAVGVFQLDGAALEVGHQIGLDEFSELYAASALCRPGASDFVGLYAENKSNAQQFQAYLDGMDPRMAAIVRPTYGVVAYQEQMMAMARVAGFDWPTVHKMRKRVAASSFHGFALGKEFGEPFVNGCVKNGIRREEAERWWEAIKQHGVYSFNKSHCVTYAYVTYWMLWLKTYHKEAYYTAFLAAEGAQSSPNPMLMKRLVSEYRRTGGKVAIVSYKSPTKTFTSPAPGIIVGGWGNLRGVGEATAEAVVGGAPKGGYASWDDVGRRLPKNVYGLLVETGTTRIMRPNPSKLLYLAQWFPVIETAKEVEDALKSIPHRLVRPGNLPYGRSQTDVLVRGYISTKWKKPRTGSFKGDQYLYTLEDETGVIVARVSSQRKELQHELKEKWFVGHYVVAMGWWTGDGTLFVQKYIIVRKADMLNDPT